MHTAAFGYTGIILRPLKELSAFKPNLYGIDGAAGKKPELA